VNRLLLFLVGLGLSLFFFDRYAQIAESSVAVRFNRLFYDWNIQTHHEPPKSGKVAIIDIDEESLLPEKGGQWPWPRYWVAAMIERLFLEGAEVVACDMNFPEPDRTSPERYFKWLERELNVPLPTDSIPEKYRNFDQVLSQAIKGKKVVLGYQLEENPAEGRPSSTVFLGNHVSAYKTPTKNTEQQRTISDFLLVSTNVIASVPILADNAHLGFYNSEADSDNIIRKVPLVMISDRGRDEFGDGDVVPTLVPSLALQAYRLFLMSEADAGEDLRVQVKWNPKDEVQGVSLNGNLVPTDRQGKILVNYRTVDKKERHSFKPRFPAWKFIDANRPLEPEIREKLKGAVVFIGSSANALHDLRTSPITQNFSGVEIQATIADNLISQDFIDEEDTLRSPLLLLAGILLTLAVCFSNSILSFLIFAGLQCGIFFLGSWLWSSKNLSFGSGGLMLALMAIFLALLFFKYWLFERRVRSIRKEFGKMVSPIVLQHLENSPKSLEHRNADAAMLFTDVIGFTQISDHLGPARTSELMNEVLSPMAEIVMEDNAYLDKFIGDMVMAVYGVPYPIKNNALEACRSALRIQQKLDEIRPILVEKYGFEVHTRTGIHAGEVIAGFMGSTARYEYTVIGDAVNVAARLEPLNKEYGTSIIISESVQEALSEDFITRKLDRVVIRGKQDKNTIFELIGLASEVSDAKIEAILFYEQALEASQNGDVLTAFQAIENAISALPEDRPSQILSHRIEIAHRRLHLKSE